MITALAFVAAAGAAALARAEATRRWNRPGRFALGTLAVNVSGSFLLGLLTGVAGPAFTVLGVGALGAFTTFSGFASDVMGPVADRRFAFAGLYLVSSCGLGLAAAAAGVALAGG